MAVKTVDELIKTVKRDIVNKFNEERVQTKIKNVNRSNVLKEVYSAYNPIRYPRRADRGGLSDLDNISVIPSKTDNGVVINISNNTEPKGFDGIGVENEFSAPIIEYGTGGNKPWEQPRPFMESTEQELRRGNLVKNTIKEISYIK